MNNKRLWLLLLIVSAGILVYSNSFDVPFQFDDRWNIVENPFIHDFSRFNASSLDNPRRYIGFLTFAINYYFGGLDVTGYHIVNLAIHIFNAILVYSLVLLTFRTPLMKGLGAGSRGGVIRDSGFPDQAATLSSQFLSPAFLVALLFVVHPIQTQAVTYIVQRFTSLATMFYLLSLVLYVKAREIQVKVGAEVEGENNQPRSSSGRFSIMTLTLTFFILSLLSAALSMRTKEIAFTLPFIVLLYEFVFFGASRRKKLFLAVITFILIIVALGVVLTAGKPLGEMLSDLSERTRQQTDMSRVIYLLTQARVLTTYIRLLFFPVNQNLDYDYPVYGSPDLQLIFSMFFLSALFAAAVYLLYKTQPSKGNAQRVEDSLHDAPYTMRRSLFRLIAFGILWFFITLSIESSIIPIVDVIFEHRVYLPSPGFFIAVVSCFLLLAQRIAFPGATRREHSREVMAQRAQGKEQKTKGNALIAQKSMLYVICTMLIIVLVLASATYARNEVWRDEITLWEDVIRKSPAKARGHINLAVACNDRKMTDRAVEHLWTALRLDPNDPEVYYNLGLVFSQKGQIGQAMEYYEKAIELKPAFAEAHYDLALDLISAGLSEQGIEHLLSALQLKPGDPEAHNSLGVAYITSGRTSEAIEHFTMALRLNPGFIEARHNLALALDWNGNTDQWILKRQSE